jgi:AraC-like DNA-binding protein
MSDRHDSASDSRARASDAAAVDPLSDVLRTVRLTGASFFLWDVRWPYTTAVPDGREFAPILLAGAEQIISYHIITQGSCWCGMPGEQVQPLHAGDILLIPHGDAYVMSSSAAECANADLGFEESLAFFRQMAAGELPFVVADGGGGPETTRVVCGFLGCDTRPFNPMLAALPRMVVVRPPAEAAQDRLRSLVDFTLAEAQRPRPGSRSVLVRLGELMFIEVVRRCLDELPAAQTGWLAALRDPTVGRALLLLHRKPAEAWTIERLAEAVGISRSRLAECFTQFVGQPPMQYLAQWRVQLAARMLADGTTKVAAAARDVGYDSEAAFSRAFKRLVGTSPAAWRRSAAPKT